MKKHVLNSWLAVLAVVVLLAGRLHAEPDEPAAKESRQPESPRRAERLDYWIGVQCSPLEDPVLRAQLDLEHHEGIVVDDVLADGPAAKAGLKRFDILVSAGDHRLRNVNGLQQAVNESQGDALKIEFYRASKQQSVSVRAAERPRGPGEPQAVMPPHDREALRQWLDSLRGGEPVMPPPAVRFFGPGIVMGPPQADLPDDMSISITRQGKQPAKIVVKQGDQTWEASEDKLSDLPADVRGEVEKLLPRRPYEPMPWPMPQSAPPGQYAPGQDRSAQDIARQLEQLRKRLDRLEQHRQSGDGASAPNR